jgi:lipopolysaccharide/colanic/teichoic acid biosynthesis glycosyltransferase
MFLAVDLFWVALSPLAALFVRDNFYLAPDKLPALLSYTLICISAAGITFVIARVHRRLWRYTGLFDVLKIMGAVTATILLALFAGFALNRLEGIARSLPVIQWLLLVGAMVGTRIAVRLLRERGRQGQSALTEKKGSTQRVLVVGLNHLTILYLRSAAEFAPKGVEIVGILCEGRELSGRILQMHKVLGTPEHLLRVLAELEVHGVIVDRIAVMQPFEQLSEPVREALLTVERSSNVRVDWLLERLGLDRADQMLEVDQAASAPTPASSFAQETMNPSFGRYGYVKRALDVFGASFFIVALAPVYALVALVVAVELGLPVLFWQQRPGRHGRPFKLYKFRTMRGAHDRDGNRILDDQRLSICGGPLRWTRLDELPQLYNILVGEMSFVGPRPLLRHEQPYGLDSRLVVRPGLTGLAQVNGRRDMAVEDKNLLDIWYIENASVWLDLKIIFLTLVVVATGEKVNPDMLHTAREGLEILRKNRMASGLAPAANLALAGDSDRAGGGGGTEGLPRGTSPSAV